MALCILSDDRGAIINATSNTSKIRNRYQDYLIVKDINIDLHNMSKLHMIIC